MSHSVSSRPGTVAARTVIVRRSPAAPLCLERRRRRDAVLARLRASSLDRRLAQGDEPEAGRLLAARATQLVAPRTRRSLADAWDDVVARAARPRAAADPRVPLARRNVLEAAGDIAALATALRSSAPVAAHDVARARILLTDGSGPVYRGGARLRPAVAELVARLTSAGVPALC